MLHLLLTCGICTFLLVIMKRKELPGLTLEKILLWTTWILNDDEMENEKSDFLLLKKNNIKWKAHKKANVREREKEEQLSSTKQSIMNVGTWGKFFKNIFLHFSAPVHSVNLFALFLLNYTTSPQSTLHKTIKISGCSIWKDKSWFRSKQQRASPINFKFEH